MLILIHLQKQYQLKKDNNNSTTSSINITHIIVNTTGLIIKGSFLFIPENGNNFLQLLEFLFSLLYEHKELQLPTLKS